jgi:4'-phosphopantetheinyl transferase
MSPTEFRVPAGEIREIASNEVHVWLANLDLPQHRADELALLLSADERERAAKFHFEKDRRHYIVSRAVLRRLLSRYTGFEPNRLLLVYGPHGKPSLAAEKNDFDLRFNLAHSHGLGLFAFTRGHEVGVDIEKIRPDFATQEIAERFFSPAEASALRALPPEVRTKAFFTCWTRKEAFIKAKGTGVFFGLHKFAVSLRPDEPAQLLSIQDAANEVPNWSLFELHPPDGYVGALAIEGKDHAVSCWLWPSR